MCIPLGLLSFSGSAVSDSLSPVDCSPPGASVYRILQAGTLEWVAMPSSRGSSRPRDQTCLHWLEGSLPRAPPGKLTHIYIHAVSVCVGTLST